MARIKQFAREDLVRSLQGIESAIAGSESEQKRLLYDLPLHQVELEIQNRDLIELQAELEGARDRYAELYDFAPVGYLSLDASGMIRNLNLTACRMLGRDRDKLIGLPFRGHLSVDSRRSFFALVQRVFESSDAVVGEFKLESGDDRVVQLQCQMHTEPDGVRTCLAILTDITTRKAAENALRGEQVFLQHLIDSINDPIMVIGLDYRILRMNRAARNVVDASGLGDEACLTCHKLTHQSDRPCIGADHPCPLRSVVHSGQPTKVVHNHYSPSGALRKFEIAVSPLTDESGDLLGVIEVNRDITEHMELLGELKANDLRFEYLAQHDPLTGLPNRVLFSDRLHSAVHVARRHKTQVAVLFIDLDRFKEVNDSFSHSHGDSVLREVASRLKGVIREEDTIARMGGDEFMVILNDVRATEGVGRVANKIIEVFREPFSVQQSKIHLGASIGISLYPDHGDSVEDLIRNADSAMYQAKDSGRMAFRFYAAELTERALERVAMETALHEALERHGMLLHYQPQFDLESGRVCGAEALIRWQHPTEGLLSPQRFLKISEDTGLILPMGRQVLQMACAQMKAWQEQGVVGPDERISVNLSTKQFDQADLFDVIEQVLAETGLGAESLELEITESAMMRSIERSGEVITRLRALGTHVAIDDFGSGYSSLAYLKLLPLTRLKIDRLFVKDIPDDPNDVAIARAIIALGKALSLDVLAEGIETVEQRDFLLREGCNAGQGFLYAKPLSASDYVDFLTTLPA